METLYGDVPESVLVREGPVEYSVDLRKGQKLPLPRSTREP